MTEKARATVDKADLAAAVEEYCRAQTAKDKVAWMGLFAEGATHEDPVGNPVNVGLEAIGTFWDAFQVMDVELWCEEPVIVCGTEAVAIMRCRVHSDGVPTEVGPIVDHMVFDHDGKIVSVRAFYEV